MKKIWSTKRVIFRALGISVGLSLFCTNLFPWPILLFNKVACPQDGFTVSVATTTYDAVASSDVANSQNQGLNRGRVQSSDDAVCIGPAGQSDFVTYKSWMLVFLLYAAIVFVIAFPISFAVNKKR